MEILRLSKPDRSLYGYLALDGSKSLSNRALIALSLAGADPAAWLSHVSSSKDTRTLQRLLAQDSGLFDAGDAGTTFRFLTAYLALRPGVQTLTGSARMQQRPVGALVQALRSLGADIRFLEKDGYPPLQIGELRPPTSGTPGIRVQADVSSQFLSALLLVAPYLPEGLELIPEGALVSKPYLEMSLRMMRYFGARVDWQGHSIVVQPGGYQPRPLRIEADWSAASYWYALAAFGDEVDLCLEGLFADSWQGDAVLASMMQAFGVQTQVTGTSPAEAGTGIRLRRDPTVRPAEFRWNFLECPDIAQTLAIICAGLGVPGEFSGLETLAIKETDRTAALQIELAKIGVAFGPIPGSAAYRVEGKAAWPTMPHFASYGDHRMAMAFAPLAMFAPVGIEHPAVVAKSYPMFWEHLKQVGFQCQTQEDDAS